jgi:hypothetical protein
VDVVESLVLLTPSGHEVQTGYDRRQRVATALASPTWKVADIGLRPTPTGYEVVRQLRQEPV